MVASIGSFLAERFIRASCARYASTLFTLGFSCLCLAPREFWYLADAAASVSLPSGCSKAAKAAMVATARPLSPTGQRMHIHLVAMDIQVQATRPMPHKCRRNRLNTIHIGKEENRVQKQRDSSFKRYNYKIQFKCLLVLNMYKSYRVCPRFQALSRKSIQK